jgi:ferredoxin
LQYSGNNIMKTFAPTTDEVTEQFRILHNEELCDLCRRHRVCIVNILQAAQLRFNYWQGQEGIFFIL